jgi:hypothetical protein
MKVQRERQKATLCKQHEEVLPNNISESLSWKQKSTIFALNVDENFLLFFSLTEANWAGLEACR